MRQDYTTTFCRSLPFLIVLIWLLSFGENPPAAQTVPPSQPTASPTPETTPTPETEPTPTTPTAQNTVADGLPRPTDTPKTEETRLPFKPAPLPVRVGVSPSDTIPLSLNDAIRRALENNNDIEVARADVRLNETNLRALEGIYDPIFSVTPTFTRNTGARNSSGQSTNDFSLNAGFDQFIPAGGGRISPFFNNARSGSIFTASGLNTSSTVINNTTSGAFFNSSIGVQYIQPLFRNRSIDDNRRQIRIQRKVLQQSDADFRRRSIETIANTQRAYWNLVFALRDQQNRADNLRLTQENMRRVEAQIGAGVAAPLARAEVATELATRENDLLLTAQSVTTAENTLKQLLLRNSAQPEWNAQLIPTDEPNFDDTPINLEEAITEARANRPELQRQKLQAEINEIDTRFFRNQNKPQIDFVSAFSLNGFTQTGVNANLTAGTFPLISGNPDLNAEAYLLNQINILRRRDNLGDATPPFVTVTPATIANGGFFPTLGNLFSTNAPTFSFGVSIGFPFRNQTAKANLAGANIQRGQIEAQTRIQEQTVITEVRNAVQAVETARQRIKTARVARENAEIQLQGEQTLFDAGRSTTFLLFERERTLVNARNSEIRAQTDFNIETANLQRATSTTLRVNNILVETLIAP